jgi:L-aminopeptidase/D-esterase-like protein
MDSSTVNAYAGGLGTASEVTNQAVNVCAPAKYVGSVTRTNKKKLISYRVSKQIKRNLWGWQINNLNKGE